MTDKTKTSKKGIKIAQAAVDLADRILTAAVALMLILSLCYSGYALWDTWQIYEGAGVDENILAYKPQLDGGEAEMTFSEILEINPDVRCWLTIDDTKIDYPVVQGSDNVKYVNTNIYGEFSLSGSLFLDYRNASDFSDFYSLIYGHHMEADAMFGELMHFVEADYFNEHQTGELLLPGNGYELEIFACLQTDAYDTKVFYPNISEETEKEDLLNYLKEEAVQYRDIGVTTADQIVGLSTCSDASTNARTVVYARMKEVSEENEEVPKAS
ncbi:MAG: class B sortase [Lachnospiraceae bacterium]|nr:class B sortase [Lachnospiraceae bacterium]